MMEGVRYARKCDLSGVGMNEGWCWGDGIFYTATEELTINELRQDYPQHKSMTDEELLTWAYEVEEVLYWTEWYEEEFCEGDVYYDAEGNEFVIEEEN